MEAIATNSLPSSSRNYLLPFKLVLNIEPKLEFFKPFGCKVWINKPKQNRNDKFDEFAWECVLIGYENDFSSNSYKNAR